MYGLDGFCEFHGVIIDRLSLALLMAYAVGQPSISFPSVADKSSSSVPISISCCGLSAGRQSVRRIFLIMLRMKCLCPYSALAMIGYASSVKRLYPTVGKHELQSSLLEKRLLPKFGFQP